MSETLGLKNINMLSKEQYDAIAEPARDELFVVSSSGFGFPSNNYDDLELGASGTQYTAPANGWFTTICKTTAANGWCNMRNEKTQLGTMCQAATNNTELRNIVIAKKGEPIAVWYGDVSVSLFRFVYSEGE